MSADGAFDRYFAACAAFLCPDDERSELLRDELASAWDSLEWTNVIDGSVEALHRLRSARFRLAVVSNSDGTVEERLRSSRVCQVGPGEGVEVEVVVDSYIVGVGKPDPRIFAIALEALGVGAHAVVHVGDALHSDVAGARAAGIRPVHFDPYELCEDADHEHARSLLDVADLVESWR